MAHILVVEDEVFLNDMIAIVLSEAGHTLVRALDGNAAIGLALEEQPDLIIMDLRLPTMDGCEAIRLLRLNPRTFQIPIIAVSASSNLRAQASSLPVDAVVSKPFDIDMLVAEVTVQLRRSGVGLPAVGVRSSFEPQPVVERLGG